MSEREPGRLESWKEIAAYLQRDVRTLRRWEKEEGLPIHRHSHKSRSSVYAYPSEIDSWRASRKVVPEAAAARPLWRWPAFAATMLLCLIMVGNGVRPVSAQQRGAAKATRQVWETGPERPTSISADGRYMSFTDYGTGDLGVRDLKTGKSRRLTSTGGWGTSRDFAEYSLVSPDSRQIAYAWWGGGPTAELRIIQTTGGTPRTVWQGKGENVVPQNWTQDSKRLLVVHSLPGGNRELAMLSIQDGSMRTIKTFKTQRLNASLSPDGRWIAYDPLAPDNTQNRDILVLAADGGPEVTAVQNPANDSTPIWSPDGSNILFRSDRTGQDALWSVPFENGRVGEAQLVKADLAPHRTDLQSMWMTRDGTLYVFSAGEFSSNIYTAELDASGKVSNPPVLAVEKFINRNRLPALSPDGLYLAYAQSGKLAIHTLRTGEERVVPTQILPRGRPRWFPDGRSVLLTSAAEPTFYRFNLSTGNAEVLQRADGPIRDFDLSPDGKTIFYAQTSPDHKGRLVRLEIGSGHESELKKGDVLSVAISPDGRQLAYTVSEGYIAVMAEGGGEAREVFRAAPWVDNMPLPLAWTPDQRYLLFIHGTGNSDATVKAQDVLRRVPVSGGPAEQLGLSMPGIRYAGVQPDARRIFFSANGPDEVWALENFLPKTTAR